MQYAKTHQGNLTLSLVNSEDKAWLTKLKTQPKWNDDIWVLEQILDHEGWQENHNLYRVAPESIAALTESPILSDGVSTEDDGTIVIIGGVWWYPNYAFSHFGETLLKDDSVMFIKAPIDTL